MRNYKEYSNIKSLFEIFPNVDIHKKRGAKFVFPIYMTDSLSKTEIESLELSTRSSHCLKRAGIETIGELCEIVHGTNELKKIRSCGDTSIAEIMDKLFAYQCSILKEEKRFEYLVKVVEMNASKIEK